MNNKRGFTPQQQLELTQLISIATAAARLTTETVMGTNEQIANAMMELMTYIRKTYPDGPLHLARSLKEICEFCDLPTIIYTEYQQPQDEPKPPPPS